LHPLAPPRAQTEDRSEYFEAGWIAMNYHVKLEPDEGGIWTAEVPALGIVTEGRGEAGARRAADRAVAGYLKGLERHGLPVPPSDVTRTFTPSRAGYIFMDQFGVGASRKQATAKKTAGRKKSAAKKTAGRQATKKATAKKTAGRQVTKKATAKKTAGRQVTKKATAKKSVARSPRKRT
jgi:predicted RNase H-like HicB family nuclease